MGAKTGYNHAINEYNTAMSVSGPAIPGVIGVPLFFRSGTGALVIIPAPIWWSSGFLHGLLVPLPGGKRAGERDVS